MEYVQYYTIIGSIVVFNYLLKEISIILIKCIGDHNKNTIMSRVIITVFICQFINTGFILMIANANFENTPLDFIGGLRKVYQDFSSAWYLKVGSQIV